VAVVLLGVVGGSGAAVGVALRPGRGAIVVAQVAVVVASGARLDARGALAAVTTFVPAAVAITPAPAAIVAIRVRIPEAQADARGHVVRVVSVAVGNVAVVVAVVAVAVVVRPGRAAREERRAAKRRGQDEFRGNSHVSLQFDYP